MSNQREQVNCRIPKETFEILKALANGHRYKTCPTCGKDWDLNKNLSTSHTEPVQHSVLASQLLEEAVKDLFNKVQFGGK